MTPDPATTTHPAPQISASQAPVPGNPQSAICNLKSNSLHARGLALFSTLMALAEIILTGIVDLLAGSHHLPNAKALPLLDKAIRCLFSLGRLHLTLQRAPQHFTARQMLRLSRAFDKIRHLTGQAFDFSPWTSLSSEELDQLSPAKSPSPSPSQSPSSGNPQSGLPQSAICNPQSAIPSVPATPPVSPVPNVNAVPAATVTATPGATLARICEDLVELAEELGLPHHFETGFLPTQSPAQSPSPSPSPSQSPSSGNL